MVPECYTQYVRPSIEECPLEHHEETEGHLVERDGYIDNATMVRRFIEAGERLEEARMMEYPDLNSVKDDDMGAKIYMDTVDLMYEEKKIVRNRKEKKEAMRDKLDDEKQSEIVEKEGVLVEEQEK